jgi:hypothetical protein
MMKQLLFGFALAGLAAASAPAAAAGQPAPATGGGVATAVACLGHRDINTYTALLRTAPYSAAERLEVQRLMPLLQRCREGGGEDAFAASVPQLRGAVAAWLYARDFAAAPAARTPALAAAALLQPAQARNPAEVQPLAATYALFDCATAAHPDLVRAYLATAAGSPEEQAGFRALGPALGACLPPGGSRQLALGGTALRGVLAEMLYRWSVVQRDGPTSPYVTAAVPVPAH